MPARVEWRSLPKVFNSLQMMRMIAALLVVFFHAADILSKAKYWNALAWKQHLDFGKSGVEIFFVLSGIVLLHAHWNDLGCPEKLGSYAWKRFRRIYPIYWIVLAFVAPVFTLHPAFATGDEHDPWVIMSSILLVHLFRPDSLLTVAWTLFHEVQFYFLFGLLLLSRRLGSALFCLWLAISCGALVHPLRSATLSEFVSPLHLLFGLGMGVALLLRAVRLRLPFLVAVLGLLGFAAGCVADVRTWHGFTGSDASLGNLLLGLSSAVMLWGLMELEREGRFLSTRFLLLLGDASYSIYLVHLPLISMFAKLLCPICTRFSVPQFVPFVLLVLFGTAGGVLVHLYIERPVLRLLIRPGSQALHRPPLDQNGSADHATSS